MKGTPINLVGQHFDKLEVVGVSGRTPSGTKWLCRCSCGATAVKLTSALRKPSMEHTGCKACEKLSRSQSRVVHGGSSYGKTHLYRAWKAINSRTTIPTDTSYPWYGAKGIRRCDTWRDFTVFRTWALANGYRQDLSIDRIDPKGNYEPSNCQWISRSENSRRAHRKHTPIEMLFGGC